LRARRGISTRRPSSRSAKATDRLAARVAHVEAAARAEGRTIGDLDAGERDRFWAEAKLATSR